MSLARLARRGLIFVGVAFTTGCGIIDPCETRADSGVDGRWTLIEVNGQGIPTPGYPLPPPSTDRLTFGSMHFQTLKYWTGAGCDEGATQGVSSGRVIAIYNLVTATGQSKPTKSYAGTFEYDHRNGKLKLKAFGRAVTGDRTGNEFTIAPSIPLFGTYVLTFQRR